MNVYLLIILITLFLDFIISSLSKYLSLNNLANTIPDDFKNYYNDKKFLSSQNYFKTNIKFDFYQSLFNLIIILFIILLGLFNTLDVHIRSFGLGPARTGLLFFGVLFFLQDIIDTPFTIYKVFVIEERFGFNKMTLKTYLVDKIKGYFIIAILGSIILFIILYFFETFQHYAWLYAWAFTSLFMLLIQPIFTLFVAPMFNTFSPLEEGSLKTKIYTYLQKVKFPIAKIDIMDGSLRSSKANAYFSGLGKNKRIALYDTLLEEYTDDEILSIIAHEIGHYKKKHNIKNIIFGIIQSGFLFFILSLFINNWLLFSAFKMQNISIYASLLFFSILYSPVDLIISIITSYISRKHEFEADQFAKKSLGSSINLINALKKLTVTNLSNLTPHPFTVFLSYSHPPVINRIRALE